MNILWIVTGHAGKTKFCFPRRGIGAGFGFFVFMEALRLKILKAINNNVISCADEDGRELVIMGRGLGFHVKPGDAPDPDRIEKVFRMDSPEETRRIQELLSRLSPELLELTGEIVKYTTQVLGKPLNQSIYLSLTDHIQFAIERSRRDMLLPNPLGTEIRVFYPEEYAIGRHALDLIRSAQQAELPEDEAAGIALHIVGAEYDSSVSVTMHAARALNPITAILESWPGLELCREELGYSELLVHLKFMAMHAFTRGAPRWSDDRLADVIEAAAPEAYACAGAICRYLSEQSGTEVPTAEQAVLALHIRRACR